MHIRGHYFLEFVGKWLFPKPNFIIVKKVWVVVQYGAIATERLLNLYLNKFFGIGT